MDKKGYLSGEHMECIPTIGHVLWFFDYYKPVDKTVTRTPKRKKLAPILNRSRLHGVPEVLETLLEHRGPLQGIVLADCCGVVTEIAQGSGPWAPHTHWCGTCQVDTYLPYCAWVCYHCQAPLLKKGKFITVRIFSEQTLQFESVILCLETCVPTFILRNVILHGSGVMTGAMLSYALDEGKELDDMGLPLPSFGSTYYTN